MEQDDLLGEIDPIRLGESIKYSRNFKQMEETLLDISKLLGDLKIDNNTMNNLAERIQQLESLIGKSSENFEQLELQIGDNGEKSAATNRAFEQFDNLLGSYAVFKDAASTLMVADGSTSGGSALMQDAVKKFESATTTLEHARNQLNEALSVCHQMEPIAFDWTHYGENEEKLNNQLLAAAVEWDAINQLLAQTDDAGDRLTQVNSQYNGIVTAATGEEKDAAAAKMQQELGALRLKLSATVKATRDDIDSRVKQWKSIQLNAGNVIDELNATQVATRDLGKWVTGEIESITNLRIESSVELEQLIEKITVLLGNLTISVGLPAEEVENKVNKLAEEAIAVR